MGIKMLQSKVPKWTNWTRGLKTISDMTVEERLKPVITIPVKLQEKTLKMREKKRLRALTEGYSLGDRSQIPIIRCRRSELNHYPGQSYKKWKNLPLASEHWYSRRTIGDFFTFSGLGASPYRNDKTAKTFQELGIQTEICDQLKHVKITKPTLIQTMGIPELLQGKNSLVASETGNGKTLTFLLPVLQRCRELTLSNPDRPLNSPLGTIVTPSRELAVQIFEVARSIGESIGLNVHFAGGGAGENSTWKRIEHEKREKVDLVVGSFGAVARMFRYKFYSYDNVHQVVLDEADSLLDDTFNSYSISFLKNFSKSHTQIVLVGATYPTSLEQILGRVLPLESLTKITTPRLHRVLSHVKQTFIRVGAINRDEYLIDALEKDLQKKNPVIVFCNKASTAEFVRLRLRDAINLEVSGLHSTFTHANRSKHFERFLRGETNVLVCTDLASRGLNTVRASHVVNYEFPLNMSDYVHRVGRVGRVGSPGGARVTNFVRGPVEVKLVQQMETAVRQNQELPNVNSNIIRILQHRKANKQNYKQAENSAEE